MSKVIFKLDKKGVGELLKSQETADMCKEFAEEIRERCGDGYEVDIHPGGKTRSNASVRASTEKAIQDNFDNNTLEKALGR